MTRTQLLNTFTTMVNTKTFIILPQPVYSDLIILTNEERTLQFEISEGRNMNYMVSPKLMNTDTVFKNIWLTDVDLSIEIEEIMDKHLSANRTDYTWESQLNNYQAIIADPSPEMNEADYLYIQNSIKDLQRKIERASNLPEGLPF